MGVSLVLGAGGLRGIGHVAFLERLRESGVVVDEVIGVSAGAVVGAVYVSGGGLAAVRGVFENALEVLLSWDRDSLYPLDRSLIEEELEDLVGTATFEDLDVDFAVPHVDVSAEEEVVVREGLVKDAVLRSMAVPGLMNDVNDAAIDGGFWSPLPLHCVDASSSQVVACDVSPSLSLVEKDSFAVIAKNIYTLGQVRLTSLEKQCFRERYGGAFDLCRPIRSEHESWDTAHVEDMYAEALSTTEEFFEGFDG